MSIYSPDSFTKDPQELHLKSLLQSSRLPHYVRAMQQYWGEEQRKREAFYNWITEDTRAEFINGETVVQSPAKDRHTQVSMYLSQLLSIYVQMHYDGLVRTETALVALTRNDYLPDICFFGVEKASLITPVQMKYPPPDLVVEILSPSTAHVDRGAKFVDYAEHGVAEYWLVDPADQTVEQYHLQEDAYKLAVKLKAGLITSEVITGFEIPVAAIFDTDAKNRTLAQMLTAVP